MAIQRFQPCWCATTTTAMTMSRSRTAMRCRRCVCVAVSGGWICGDGGGRVGVRRRTTVSDWQGPVLNTINLHSIISLEPWDKYTTTIYLVPVHAGCIQVIPGRLLIVLEHGWWRCVLLMRIHLAVELLLLLAVVATA